MREPQKREEFEHTVLHWDADEELMDLMSDGLPAGSNGADGDLCLEVPPIAPGELPRPVRKCEEVPAFSRAFELRTLAWERGWGYVPARLGLTLHEFFVRETDTVEMAQKFFDAQMEVVGHNVVIHIEVTGQYDMANDRVNPAAIVSGLFDPETLPEGWSQSKNSDGRVRLTALVDQTPELDDDSLERILKMVETALCAYLFRTGFACRIVRHRVAPIRRRQYPIEAEAGEVVSIAPQVDFNSLNTVLNAAGESPEVRHALKGVKDALMHVHPQYQLVTLWGTVEDLLPRTGEPLLNAEQKEALKCFLQELLGDDHTLVYGRACQVNTKTRNVRIAEALHQLDPTSPLDDWVEFVREVAGLRAQATHGLCELEELDEHIMQLSSTLMEFAIQRISENNEDS